MIFVNLFEKKEDASEKGIVSLRTERNGVKNNFGHGTDTDHDGLKKDTSDNAGADCGSMKEKFADDVDAVKIIEQIQQEKEQIMKSIDALENLDGEAALAVGNIIEYRERTNQKMIEFLTQNVKERYYAMMKEQEAVLSRLITALQDILDNDGLDMDVISKAEVIEDLVFQMGNALHFKQ